MFVDCIMHWHAVLHYSKTIRVLRNVTIEDQELPSDDEDMIEIKREDWQDGKPEIILEYICALLHHKKGKCYLKLKKQIDTQDCFDFTYYLDPKLSKAFTNRV